MFDITSSKLLLLGIVALLVIGPKDFPALLRTIGKYVGIVRGHAKEFRAQFDEAMRESELADLKKDVENIARGDGSVPAGHRANGGEQPQRGAPEHRHVDRHGDEAAARSRSRTMPTGSRLRRRRRPSRPAI